MGHCVESGYGLINKKGDVRVFDAKATPKLVSAVSGSKNEQGIVLRATREKKDEEMETTKVEEV